jgi:hypothetical protein
VTLQEVSHLLWDLLQAEDNRVGSGEWFVRDDVSGGAGSAPMDLGHCWKLPGGPITSVLLRGRR